MKYLTQVTEEQRTWIRKAAEELDVTHPTIVQMALDRLIAAGDLERVKEEMREQKKRKALEEIENQIKELKSRKEQLLSDEVEIPA